MGVDLGEDVDEDADDRMKVDNNNPITPRVRIEKLEPLPSIMLESYFVYYVRVLSSGESS